MDESEDYKQSILSYQVKGLSQKLAVAFKIEPPQLILSNDPLYQISQLDAESVQDQRKQKFPKSYLNITDINVNEQSYPAKRMAGLAGGARYGTVKDNTITEIRLCPAEIVCNFFYITESAYAALTLASSWIFNSRSGVRYGDNQDTRTGGLNFRVKYFGLLMDINCLMATNVNIPLVEKGGEQMQTTTLQTTVTIRGYVNDPYHPVNYVNLLNVHGAPEIVEDPPSTTTPQQDTTVQPALQATITTTSNQP